MNEINLGCTIYNKKNNFLYGFARNCNALFEIHPQTGEIIYLCELEDEVDDVDLIFQMTMCGEKLILTPRYGKYIHIFDVRTREQSILPWSIFPEELGNRMANVYAKPLDDATLLLVIRYPAILLEVNLNDMKINRRCDLERFSMDSVSFLSMFQSNFIGYDFWKNNICSVDLKTFEGIGIPTYQEVSNVYNNEEFIFFYAKAQAAMYQYDYSGHFVSSFCVSESLKGKSVLVRFQEDLAIIIEKEDQKIYIANLLSGEVRTVGERLFEQPHREQIMAIWNHMCLVKCENKRLASLNYRMIDFIKGSIQTVKFIPSDQMDMNRIRRKEQIGRYNRVKAGNNVEYAAFSLEDYLGIINEMHRN